MKLFSFRPFVTGYAPDGSPMEGGWMDDSYDDVRGETDPLYKAQHALISLEDFIAYGRSHVSVAMDRDIFPYGTLLCSPDFNSKYKIQIVFKLVDTGGRFVGKKLTKLDICTADQAGANDDFLNQPHDFVALLG